MSETSFKYFLHPHEFSTYTSTPQLCDLCREKRAGYVGPFYGTEQIEFVCENCLTSGKLSEFGSFTNIGETSDLKKQLKEIHLEYSETQIEKLAVEIDDELLHKTPHVVTWQDFSWPVHCGDYCCFIKEAGKPDLISITPEDKVHLLFNTVNDERFKLFWEEIRPDSPKNNSTTYSVGVYLFQCLHCKKYIALNDCD
jgi:uncharacterized protein CbrC (UPF0167 family)